MRFCGGGWGRLDNLRAHAPLGVPRARRAACYQSGASFKDGGKKDSTTFTQNLDAFPMLIAMYEKHWQAATPKPLLP
jgi:hypothetical protein